MKTGNSMCILTELGAQQISFQSLENEMKTYIKNVKDKSISIFLMAVNYVRLSGSGQFTIYYSHREFFDSVFGKYIDKGYVVEFPLD